MSAASPMALIRAEQSLQLQLCDVLEHLADGLPGVGDRRLAQMASVGLTQGMVLHRDIGEKLLFPLMRKRGPASVGLMPLLTLLEREHAADQDQSYETAEELRALADSGRADNPGMLGYMLRGTFESLRRHVGWEKALVMPYAETAFCEEDLEAISAWFAADGRAGDLMRMQESLRFQAH